MALFCFTLWYVSLFVSCRVGVWYCLHINLTWSTTNLACVQKWLFSPCFSLFYYSFEFRMGPRGCKPKAKPNSLLSGSIAAIAKRKERKKHHMNRRLLWAKLQKYLRGMFVLLRINNNLSGWKRKGKLSEKRMQQQHNIGLKLPYSSQVRQPWKLNKRKNF